jgi:hypothetical protein
MAEQHIIHLSGVFNKTINRLSSRGDNAFDDTT